MPEVGIRTLKIHASEIIRTVREKRAQYTVTHRGKPVAILMPLSEIGTAPTVASADEVWETLIVLGKEISQKWESPQTSAQVLSEMRR